ncbi:MAG: ethylbenzene dehydrogenase-related protein [Acidobacteriota bacterium]
MKKILALLTVMGLTALALAVLGRWVEIPANAQAKTSLTASIGTPQLDGVESPGEWTSDSIVTSRGVTIKAMMDDQNLYLLATWADSTESVAKNSWTFDGTNWNASGDEDRVAFVWDVKDAQGQSLNGSDGALCATMCHSPQMRTNFGRVDVWHWKANRFNPMGFADDKYWDTCQECEDGGRHGDEGSGSGGRNRNAEKTGPAFMAASDPGANVAFLADDAGVLSAFDPFSVMPGSVDVKVPIDETAAFSVGDTIPGRVLSIPSGNRASVHTAGKWDNGVWTVEFSRKLGGEVGSDGMAEDFAVVPGGSVDFSTEVFDDVSDTSQHAFTGGSADFTLFTLVFPSRDLYFAQFGDADGLSSQITLFNTARAEQSSAAATAGAGDANATLIFKDSQGDPLSVDINGTDITGEVEAVIPPSAVRVFKTDGVGDITVGSVTVESDQPLSGVILFGGTEGLAGVGSSEALADGFSAPMESDSANAVDTGIAVMNLEDVAVTLDLELSDADGNVISTAQLDLPARGQSALFVTQFAWDPAVDFTAFRGLLRVTSSGRIGATVIQTRPGQFATLPVAPN